LNSDGNESNTTLRLTCDYDPLRLWCTSWNVSTDQPWPRLESSPIAWHGIWRRRGHGSRVCNSFYYTQGTSILLASKSNDSHRSGISQRDALSWWMAWHPSNLWKASERSENVGHDESVSGCEERSDYDVKSDERIGSDGPFYLIGENFLFV